MSLRLAWECFAYMSTLFSKVITGRKESSLNSMSPVLQKHVLATVLILQDWLDGPLNYILCVCVHAHTWVCACVLVYVHICKALAIILRSHPHPLFAFPPRSQ